MNHGKHNWISLYQVIGGAVQELALNNPSPWLDAMARWAFEAELKIGGELSHRDMECTIQVEDYKACLPDNLIELYAVKHGRDYLDVSTKDFSQWNRGSAKTNTLNPESSLAAVPGVTDPGQAMESQIVVEGVFQPGDFVTVNATVNINGALTPNYYTYTVQVGDDQDDIANALYQQMINGNIDFQPTLSANIIDIVGDTPYVAFQVSVGTDAVNGTISYKILVPRRMPNTAINEPVSNPLPSPKEGSIHLADQNTHNLDSGSGSQKYDYDGSFFADDYGNSSKYSIQNQYIYFSKIESGTVGLSYKSVELDEEGLPLIRSAHERAVINYIKFRFREIDYTNGKVAHHVYKELEGAWDRECGNARGSDVMTPDNIRMWSQIMNSLMPLPGLQRS